MKNILEQLINGESLSQLQAFDLIQEIAASKFNSEILSGILVALQMKGMSLSELSGFRESLLEKAVPLNLNSEKFSSKIFFLVFVIIEKFISVENEFAFKDGWMLTSYFWLKKLSLSDERAFGLDKSDVEIEEYPMVYSPVIYIDLNRK